MTQLSVIFNDIAKAINQMGVVGTFTPTELSAAIKSIQAKDTLPEEYTRLKYVNTMLDDDNKPFINTDFVLSAGNAIETKVCYNDVNTRTDSDIYQCIFCCRSSSAATYTLFMKNAVAYKLDYGKSTTGSTTQYTIQSSIPYILCNGNALTQAKIFGRVDYTLDILPNEAFCINTDFPYDTGIQDYELTDTINENNKLVLFGSYPATASSISESTPILNNANLRMYYFKVWEDSTKSRLLLNLVPCTNSEGTTGMFDLVSSKFISPTNGILYNESHHVQTMSDEID